MWALAYLDLAFEACLYIAVMSLSYKELQVLARFVLDWKLPVRVIMLKMISLGKVRSLGLESEGYVSKGEKDSILEQSFGSKISNALDDNIHILGGSQFCIFESTIGLAAFCLVRAILFRTLRPFVPGAGSIFRVSIFV